jgi:hypothetical protein
MLPLKRFSLPREHGEFAVVRKYDIHTGIDLYCNPGAHVFAIEDGFVSDVGNFTGASANSPWWNDTQYIVVKGNSGFILYGELATSLEKGALVKKGGLLGEVVTVLKENKEKPMTMLHLELYSDYTEPVVWNHGCEKPYGLQNPTGLITKELWAHYDKTCKSHEVIEIEEGDWFNIAGRGLVMTVNLRKLDASIRICAGDNVKISNKLYCVRGIECPGGQSEYAGLLLREIIEENND